MNNQTHTIEILPDHVDEAFTMRNQSEQRFFQTYSDAMRITRGPMKIKHESVDTSNRLEKIIDLKETNQKLSEKLFEYKHINKGWEEKLSEITHLVHKLEDDNYLLQEENKRLYEAIEEYEYKLNSLENKDRSHDKALESIKGLQKDYEKQIINLNNEHKLKEEKLRLKYENYNLMLVEKYNLQIIESNEKIKKIMQESNEMKRAFDRAERDNIEMKSLLEKYDHKIKTQCDEYEDALFEKDKICQELESYATNLKEESVIANTRYEGVIEKLEEELNFLKRRQVEQNIEQSEKLNQTVHVKEENLETQLHDIKTKYIEENNELKHELEGLRNRNQELENENEALNKKLAENNEEIRKLKNDVKKLFSKLKENEARLEKTYEEKNSEIENLTEKLNNYEQNLDNFYKENENLKYDLDRTRTELNKLQSSKEDELKFIHQKYERTIRELRGKLEEVLFKDSACSNSFSKYK